MYILKFEKKIADSRQTFKSMEKYVPTLSKPNVTVKNTVKMKNLSFFKVAHD